MKKLIQNYEELKYECFLELDKLVMYSNYLENVATVDKYCDLLAHEVLTREEVILEINDSIEHVTNELQGYPEVETISAIYNPLSWRYEEYLCMSETEEIIDTDVFLDLLNEVYKLLYGLKEDIRFYQGICPLLKEVAENE